MSLEETRRRRPDITGIPVTMRNGEDFLIPLADMKPVFEKKDGQFMFVDVEMAEPFRSHCEKFREVWGDAAEKGKLELDRVRMEELQKLTMELCAAALNKNYELTVEELGDLIDPLDQKMMVGMLRAVRGEGDGRDEATEEKAEAEKKTLSTG